MLSRFAVAASRSAVARSSPRCLAVVARPPAASSALARPPACAPARRPLSEAPKPAPQAAGDGSDVDDLVPLTPAQKVGVGLNLGAWAAGLSLAAVCGYYIVRELLPTKMSPNSVFDRAFAVVVADERVQRIYGDPLKGYGRDHGGHREGRRNFIENTAYDDEQDGSKRLRVRFNVKGPYSEGFVFAEISNKMDDFVYLMVQDKRTGRVVTLEDNRLAMQAASGARTDAERSALQGLLGGSFGGDAAAGPPKY